MKSAKKFMSLLLALVMVLALAIPAFAVEGEGAEKPLFDFVLKNPEPGHIYEVYQVFSGDMTEEVTGEGDSAKTTYVLTNIDWGTGVNGAGVLAYVNGKAAQDPKIPQGGFQSADEIAKFITSKNIHRLIEAITAGNLTTTCTVLTQSEEKIGGNYHYTAQLSAGYYFVKDKDGSLDGKEYAYTEYILKVVHDVSTEPKTGTVTFDKQIADSDDSSEDQNVDDKGYGVWQDSADWDIGDLVPYLLTATLPDNFDSYETYKMVFHDKASAGLTFRPDTVKLFIAKDETSPNIELPSTLPGLTGKAYEVNFPEDHPDTFDLSIPDLKVYKTYLEEKGVTLSNKCVVRVFFRAELNENAKIGYEGNPNDAYLEFSNNPNAEGTGKTPEQRVIAYTFKLKVNKVTTGEDGKNVPLTGAKFKIYKFIYNVNEVDEYGNTGHWEEEKNLEVTSATTADGKEVPEAVFSVKGVDAGWYRIVETQAPDGYNKIDDIFFEVVAVHGPDLDENGYEKLVSLTATATDAKRTPLSGKDVPEFSVPGPDGGTGTDVSISTDVVNEKGSTLPETGGVGTTIFYVVGSVLVLAAVVLLVAKKRMSVEG